MKVRSSSRRKVVKEMIQPDPEEMALAERAANLERLRALRDEAKRRVAGLKWQSEAARNARIATLKREREELKDRIEKLKGKAWLMYLPSSAGSPAVITRAYNHLQAMQTRVEASGGKMWLCQDHDCQTRTFTIDEFRIFEGAVFCSGQFTARKYRDAYKGVSPDFITFMGDDVELVSDIIPPSIDCMKMSEMPAEVQAAAQSDQVFGLAGAACLSFPPAYGVTGIYRLNGDKKLVLTTT